jgi:hypothetical protein
VDVVINRAWASVDWRACIVDASTHLTIRHHCVPLTQAFGTSADAWSSAFLQGAYQHWFGALGIDPALSVRQVDAGDARVHEYQLNCACYAPARKTSPGGCHEYIERYFQFVQGIRRSCRNISKVQRDEAAQASRALRAVTARCLK